MVTNDWQNADAQNQRMYRGFVRAAMIGTALVAIALILIAMATI